MIAPRRSNHHISVSSAATLSAEQSKLSTNEDEGIHLIIISNF